MNQQELFDKWPPLVVPKANEPGASLKHWTGSALTCLERQRNCHGCQAIYNLETVAPFNPQQDNSCSMPFAVQTLIGMRRNIPTILTDGPVGGFLRRGERL